MRFERKKEVKQRSPRDSKQAESKAGSAVVRAGPGWGWL